MPKVVIVGGGIGGATAAVALLRHGFDVEVYEQAPNLREVGAGIRLTPNATRLLRLLGVGEKMEEIAAFPQRQVYKRWDGETRKSDAFGANIEQKYGAPVYQIHRAHCLDVLVAALPPGVIRTGRKCVAITQHDDHVECTFADGSNATGDLAVGADGFRSTIRQRLFGPDSPRYSGDNAHRGLVRAELVPELSERPTNIWVGPHKHFVQSFAGKDFVNIVALVPGEPGEESWVARGNKAALLEEFAGWDPLVLKLIREADDILPWPLYDRDPMKAWSKGRVTLLGDAAHPLMPYMAQGASQTIEDAYVLAEVLSLQADDIPAALKRYEALRIPRATTIQLGSRQNQQLYHLPDGEAQRKRDAAWRSDGPIQGVSGTVPQNEVYEYDASRALA